MFSTVSTVVVLLAFFWASCKNPGQLKPSKDVSFIELLRDVNPADLCPECKVIRSVRSRHCAICNRCVERFDHHCPWINNCVGVKNHNAFLFFLASIWIKIVYHIVVDIYSLVDLLKNGIGEYTHHEYEGICVLCTNVPVKITSTVVCILICSFYFLLSTILLNVHIRNYMHNRTTHERFGKRAKKVEESSEEEGEAEDSMSIYNTSEFES